MNKLTQRAFQARIKRAQTERSGVMCSAELINNLINSPSVLRKT